MQVIVWIIIILLIIFLIWLLRKWIKRIIFILILLALAFLIYGIFNPSGAARLWYNVRTFPSRVTSRISSSKEFLDYDSYKLNVSSIGDEIDLGKDDEDEELSGNEQEVDVNMEFDEKNEEDSGEIDVKLDKNSEKTEEKVGKQVIKAFPRSIQYVEIPSLKKESKSGKLEMLTGFQKSDLLGIINKYIENNLDDDTDILVTVEYEEDGENPSKIILQTQPKVIGARQSISFSKTSLTDLLKTEEPEEIIAIPSEDIVIEKPTNQEKNSNQSSNKTTVSNKATSNNLTQKEQKEAEEIFSILF